MNKTELIDKIAAAAAIADGDLRHGNDRHTAGRGDGTADDRIDVDHVPDLAHGIGHHIRQGMIHERSPLSFR